MSILGSSCLSAFGKITNGDYFTPIGRDICRKCKCLAGQAVGCINETCPNLPNCEKYEQVKGKCCEFECLEDDGFSNKSELAVILSLSIGLVLLLLILLTVLYCRRRSMKKEKQCETKQQTTCEQPNNTATTTTAVGDTQASSTTATSEVTSRGEERPREVEIELPPPYSLPENMVNQKRTRHHELPPNEPPPPYDREESSV